jgi:HAD superfamily hydrolase (TIGR01509 family)
VHGLLIDLDGVLRHRDPAVVQGSERDAGLPAGSIMAAAFDPVLLQSVVIGVITQDEWEAEIIRVLAWRYPSADAATAVKKTLGDVGYLDPAVLEVVDAVRPQVTVCVVSNASTRLHADLELLGLRDHVDCVLSSADFGIAKPDPRIFAEGARLVGVPPRDCLMVDDSATITAAAAAVGMTVHTFTDPVKLEQWLTSVLRHAR